MGLLNNSTYKISIWMKILMIIGTIFMMICLIVPIKEYININNYRHIIITMLIILYILVFLIGSIGGILSVFLKDYTIIIQNNKIIIPDSLFSQKNILFSDIYDVKFRPDLTIYYNKANKKKKVKIYFLYYERHKELLKAILDLNPNKPPAG